MYIQLISKEEHIEELQNELRSLNVELLRSPDVYYKESYYLFLIRTDRNNYSVSTIEQSDAVVHPHYLGGGLETIIPGATSYIDKENNDHYKLLTLNNLYSATVSKMDICSEDKGLIDIPIIQKTYQHIKERDGIYNEATLPDTLVELNEELNQNKEALILSAEVSKKRNELSRKIRNRFTTTSLGEGTMKFSLDWFTKFMEVSYSNSELRYAEDRLYVYIQENHNFLYLMEFLAAQNYEMNTNGFNSPDEERNSIFHNHIPIKDLLRQGQSSFLGRTDSSEMLLIVDTRHKKVSFISSGGARMIRLMANKNAFVIT